MSRRVVSLLRFFLLFLLISQARAQDVRITEFMASNLSGIHDDYGTLQGWIEIWNPSTAAKISLAGWSLYNGTVSWVFPAIELPPDERILVWASGKDRKDVTAPLHTSFTLPKAGGILQLRRNTSPPTIANPSYNPYPAQTDNVSYGVDFAAPNLFGYYTTPTPGDPNNFSGSGVAGKVNFSKASGAITASFQLTLTQATPIEGAEIRYTLNGSVPNATSTKYVTPFTVPPTNTPNTTTVVRARIFAPGLLPGEIETAGYLFLDATTSAFSSQMPIFVIMNFGLGTPPDTGDQASFMWLWETAAPDNRARFTNAPKLTGRTVIDRRGSSTLGNLKHNVNVEFRRSRDDSDRDVSILGMAEGSDYVLSGPYNFDRSDLHNPLAYALSRSINRYAPDSRQVEVFFDTNGGPLNAPNGNSNDYFGIYNLMEKIRRDNDRVNVHKLDVYDNDAVGKTGGFIWKIDRLDTGDSGFTAGGQTMAFYYPKEVELKIPQRDDQEQYLAHATSGYVAQMYTVLQGPTYNNPTFGYAKWLDVPACIDHHLVNVWALNVDALRLSGYWYKERGGKMAAGPVWDFDRALSSTDGRDAEPNAWTAWRGTGDATDFFNYPWWNRLFGDIEFYQKYIDRWQELRRGTLSQANVEALINTLAGTVKDEAVARDLARWGFAKRSWTRPFSPFNTIAASQAAEIQRLKDYLQKRADFFDTQWVGPVALTPNGGNVAPGQQVTMTGPAGADIYYTLDGIDPRPTGGAVPPVGSALKYSVTGPITINATTRIRARAYKATQTALTGANNPSLISKWSGMRNERYSTDTPAAAGNLVVTEINYHPLDPTAAELAKNPVFTDKDFEFFEVKNIGSAPIDLGGAQVTSGVQFTFSGDNAITLAPSAFAVVAANPQGFMARYPNGAPPLGPWTGDLSNSGEKLVIKAANGSTILNFTYDGDYYGADGGGATLVVYDLLATGAAYGAAANWRSSAAAGGSPGATEPNLPPSVVVGSTVNGNVTGAALAATITDDRQPDPPKAITVAWSQQGGPGTAMFESPNSAATNVTFTEPGIYVLRLTADDGGLSGFGEVSVFAKDTAETWLARHPGIGGLEEDFDQDGWNNYFEFSQGLDPTVPDVIGGPVSMIEDGYLTLTYSRIKPPSTVLYEVEVADAPDAFRTPNPGEISEVILFDTGITQTVKAVDTVSTAAQPNRFLRLKVRPAP